VGGTLAIFKRELLLYFLSPIAWIVLSSFLFILGFIFYGELVTFVAAARQAGAGLGQGATVDVNLQVVTPFFFNIGFVGLFLLPLLTMRLLAEERRQGTLELLLTYPVRDLEVVLGKYLAALALYALMLAGTFWTVGVLVRYGNPDPGPILSGYLGVFLYGGAFIALGLMLSSLTENQIVAATLSFILFLLLWLLQWGSTMVEGAASEVLRTLSVVDHFQAMSQGIFDTKDLVFFLSVIVFALFVSHQSLAARRWSGD
jgi:ABC-2 type transport system permease protein